MISSSAASTSNDIDSVSSVPQLFQQAVLSALPEDGSCVEKANVVTAAQRAQFNDKKLRDRYFEILIENFVIGKMFVPPSTDLLFRVTETGPKHCPDGFVISAVPRQYSWNAPAAPSWQHVLNHGAPRGDEPAFRRTILNVLQKESLASPFVSQDCRITDALWKSKWLNRQEREKLLQNMIDEGILQRRRGILTVARNSDDRAVENHNEQDFENISDAILSILPKDGSCILLSKVAEFLVAKGWTDKKERLNGIDSLIKSFVVGKALSRTDTLLFLVTKNGPNLPRGAWVISKVPPQYASSWTVPIASKQTRAENSESISDHQNQQQNSASYSSVDSQVASHQSFFPPPPPSSYSSSALLPPPTMTNTSLQNNSVASLKTATKLYFENIKDLVPSEGLEKSSVMVLMGHQHGWKDQNMQQEFLDELSSKGLVQLRSDPANPGLIKLFCTSPSEQHQQQLSQPPSIANGPQRRTRSPDVTPNVNSSNTGSCYSQHQPREVVHILPIFAGTSPLAVPPPQLVRNGQPVNRTNLSVLMKMPPPFKVERSYYH